MAQIKINPAVVLGASVGVALAQKATGAAASGIASTRWSIDGRILGRHNIGNRLGNVQSTVEQIAADIQSLNRAVNRGANLYNATENRIISMGVAMCNMAPGGRGSAGSGVGAVIAAGTVLAEEDTESVWKRFFDGTLEEKVTAEVRDKGNGLIWNIRTVGASASASAEYGKYEDEDDTRDKTKKKKVNKVYNKKTGEELNPKNYKFPEKKGTIAEAKAEAKAEASILEMTYTTEQKYGTANVDAKFGTVEAHAEVAAGLYTYDVNGVMLTGPAVSAKIGASVSAISATAEGRMGLGEDHNMLGVYGKGDIDVLKAGAEAKAEVALFSKDGKIDPSVYAEAKAEALLVEAKGTAGLTVLGADVGVTGSVNVGVGAHAKVGMENGVVKVDVGASMGFGVSVGFEVDVGGFVDTVCGAAESAWTAFTGWLGN